MQEVTTKGIYDFQSLFYDATFGRLVKRRIARAIGHMNIDHEDKVLDLGIGTGASLSFLAECFSSLILAKLVDIPTSNAIFSSVLMTA